jgi:hypothetical protein
VLGVVAPGPLVLVGAGGGALVLVVDGGGMLVDVIDVVVLVVVGSGALVEVVVGTGVDVLVVVAPGTVVVVHMFGPGTHALAPLHLSPTVQALLSLQGVSAGLAGFWQPSVALQVSVVQALLSLQLRGGVGDRQIPLVHCSTPLHTLPSVQDVPSATATLSQPKVASHESDVQALASLQFWRRQKLEQPSQLAVFPD